MIWCVKRNLFNLLAGAFLVCFASLLGTTIAALAASALGFGWLVSSASVAFKVQPV